MRILLAIPLLLAAGACNVSRDEANNTISLTVNEQKAQNAAADVGNQVQNIANDVGNEAKDLGNKVQNTDVDVNANVKTENKTK